MIDRQAHTLRRICRRDALESIGSSRCVIANTEHDDAALGVGEAGGRVSDERQKLLARLAQISCGPHLERQRRVGRLFEVEPLKLVLRSRPVVADLAYDALGKSERSAGTCQWGWARRAGTNASSAVTSSAVIEKNGAWSVSSSTTSVTPCVAIIRRWSSGGIELSFVQRT